MKRLLICFSLFMFFRVQAQDDTLGFEPRTVNLDGSSKVILNQRFGQWELCDSYVYKYDDEQGIPIAKSYSDVIAGDFDGDGERDFAALIKTSEICYLVVLFRTNQSYTLHVIDSSHFDFETIIWLVPKDMTEYELTTQKPHRHKADAIGFGYYGKGGGTYFYYCGEFHFLYISD